MPAAKAHVALISLYSTDAIGLRYIAAVLERHGHKASLVFFKELHLTADAMTLPDEEEYLALIGLLKRIKPDLVGISLRTAFGRIAESIDRRIRRELAVPVIWGGTHPTVDPEDSIGRADMICLGEGEYPMLELAERLAAGSDPSSIPNLWLRTAGGIVRNEVRPLITDLDGLPFPVYGGPDVYFIENGALAAGDPVLLTYNLNILASRGCPYQCAYCCNSVVNRLYDGKGPVIRRRSVDNVMAEIHALRGRFPRVKRIDFIDEVFAWDRDWTGSFIARYKAEIGLPFQCAQHPNMVRPEILTMLKSAGLERVEIGIQSGAERIRNACFERPVSDRRILQAARLMRTMGIVPFYDLIVDNPFEDENDKRAGLDLILNLPRPFHLHLFSLKFFPHTIATRRALAARLISEADIEGRGPETSHRMFVTLKDPRPDSERFWVAIVSLASKSFVPKSLIRWLSRRRSWMTHPGPLVRFAGLANTLKLAMIAAGWLAQGKPVFSTLRQTAKRKTSPII